METQQVEGEWAVYSESVSPPLPHGPQFFIPLLKLPVRIKPWMYWNQGILNKYCAQNVYCYRHKLYCAQEQQSEFRRFDNPISYYAETNIERKSKEKGGKERHS
jgi:hypothetical protein